MKISLNIIFLLISILLNAQIELKVVTICEFEESVLYECMDRKHREIYIVSEKTKNENILNSERIETGKSYLFDLQERGFQTAGKFILRVGKKVYWQSGDDYDKFPYFSRNVVGLYYIKND